MRLLLSLLGLCFIAVRTLPSQAEVFTDRNGLFAATPPVGWTKQTYPEETSRGKIAFHDPLRNGVSIRVIASPTLKSSIHELLPETLQKLPLLRQKLPGATVNASIQKVGEDDAIVQVLSMPGNTYQRITMFIENGVLYSIACSAKSLTQFQSASGDFDSFIASFVRLSPGRKMSEDEVKKAQAARAKRLANLYSEDGNKQEALGWVNQGLEFDPNDPELDQMKKNQGQSKQSQAGDSPEGDEEDFPWWAAIVLIVGGLAIMGIGAFFRS